MTYIFILAILGRDSAVGIATHYEMDSPGIETRWGRDIPHLYRQALMSCKIDTASLSQGERGRSVALTTYSYVAPRCTSASPPPWTFMACFRVKCNFLLYNKVYTTRYLLPLSTKTTISQIPMSLC